MPNLNKFNHNGFSLVELLVVISIIIILSTIGMTVYTQAEVTSRDNQRLADIKQVQAALEQYRNDAGYYPLLLNFNSGGNISYNNLLPSPNNINNIYLNILPRDPLYRPGFPRLNYKYIPRPSILLGDPRNCTNVINGNNYCSDYCLLAQKEVIPSSPDLTCLTNQPGYNYSVRKGKI